jgi:hypothetical protein
MACRLSYFSIEAWETIQHRGHVVEVASATTKGKGTKLDGVVYKLDGVFQGFTGTKDAAIYWVNEKLDGKPADARR